jgi:transketolase
VETSETDLLKSHARKVRRRVLELAHSVNKGHIGSALSVVDIVTVAACMTRGFGSSEESRDRFVLSKGHAAMALYACLEELGCISETALSTYCNDNTLYATHPLAQSEGIDFSTGSLGQGITFAVGAALAGEIIGDDRRVFCILSDSELDEGSTWEAALFAAHRRLANLIVLLDSNGQQALARTESVLSVTGVPAAWEALGWDVRNIDGHDVKQIAMAIRESESQQKPSLIVANTKAGFGVSFMESRIEWHYLPMSEEQYVSALNDIEIVDS